MKADRRQVHETKGSYYIYLPKKWVKKWGIAKDDAVNAIEFFDGSLFLGVADKAKAGREVVIDIDELGEAAGSLLNKYLLASYIIGASRITIKAKDKIKAAMREDVSHLIRILPGFEIVHEDTHVLQAKEIGQVSDITSVLQTLFSTTTMMLKSLADLTEGDGTEQEIEAIIRRDDDVDRFRYMVDRQSHLILADPFLGARLKLNPVSTLHFAQIATQIERVGDHCVELGQLLLENIDQLDILLTSIQEPLEEAVSIFEALSRINQKGTYLEALDLLERVGEQEVIIQEELHTRFGLAFYHIGRIISYSKNISEIIIDQIVAEQADFIVEEEEVE